MKRTRSLIVAAVLAPGLLLGAGVVLARDVPEQDAGAVGAAYSGPALDPALAAGSDLDATVGALRQRLQRLPDDDAAWAALGIAYLGQARTSADPTFYGNAEQALARSLELAPEGNADALAGQAALANARHAFASGRDLAQAAVEADPYDATAHGVLADAQIELGDLDAALDSLDEMLRLKPGVPSFTRTAYSYELRGDIQNARFSLERALEVAVTDADAAFVLLQLGDLAFSQGDLAASEQAFADGLRRDPGRVPLLASQARAWAAGDRMDEAIAQWANVVERLPQPSYLVEYGELLDAAGRPDEAAAQYAAADAAAQLFAASGSVPDVEVLLYQADHGRAEQALAGAQKQYESRRSPHVLDALAWALHVNGRDGEALAMAEQAQDLGSRNALASYHRGMIQLALDDADGARVSLQEALDLNPAFSSLHAPLARTALARIGAP